MSKGIKAALVIVAILTFALTFLWCASFTFRFLMSAGSDGLLRSLIRGHFTLTDQVRSYPWDIIFYQKNYGHLYAGKFKGAWWVSGLLHAAIAFLLYKIFEKEQSLYGDARFATPREIAKAKLFISPKEAQKPGLFAGTRIIVGRFAGRYIGLGGQLFASLMAPTRSGKGVGVVVPVALSYADSMVVSDIKQELFQITAAYRAKCGHAVYLFNPFDAQGRTARWNPLSYVSRTPEMRVDDLNQIAICLIPDGGGDDGSFFEESARKLFLGLGLYCLDKEKYHLVNNAPVYVPTIKEILNLATDFTGDAIAHFSSLMNDEFVSSVTLQAINSAVSSGDKTFASILATLTANLTPWLSTPVSNATSADDFDLRDVRKKRMTIYLGIQPGDLAKSSKIINLFYSQLIHENTRVLPQNDRNLKYQCLMLMDEGTAAGRIAILENAVSYMAGYNLRLLFVAQSSSQLENRKIYGEHGTRNILTNIALKVLYKPNDIKDSEDYSKLLGKITIKADTSRSRGGGSKGISKTETQNSRDLMMPQELREMAWEKEIIIYDSMSHPIMAEKNIYHEDPVFVSRTEGHGKAVVKPIKARISAQEYYAPIAKQVIRDETRKYRSRVEKNLDEKSGALGLKSAILGNFIGQMIEANSIEPATSEGDHANEALQTKGMTHARN